MPRHLHMQRDPDDNPVLPDDEPPDPTPEQEPPIRDPDPERPGPVREPRPDPGRPQRALGEARDRAGLRSTWDDAGIERSVEKTL